MSIKLLIMVIHLPFYGQDALSPEQMEKGNRLVTVNPGFTRKMAVIMVRCVRVCVRACVHACTIYNSADCDAVSVKHCGIALLLTLLRSSIRTSNLIPI